ncbi:gliding motility-associated-like protein [Nonlabens dokdonensis]|jgi:gliding motility-associated-like protein|uniref:C-type lectin domain protein n=2 Tax=Nonlabens dokdonensis TaxID=328515 RepID=L7WDV4_NONDD|nr:T9SS type B sorting domain-containing protein [Nonlabens dokdonensis]AGC78264.1 c-type lectin domain protein [Nonlabens dokdonensis DSW-6]PZX37849.1 gliding motility-associated-like protein [Nonlabens dokdonensis]
MIKSFTFILLLLFNLAFAKAQLGFCNGQSGAVIFSEDFGQGTTNGPALPNSVTSYTFVNNGVQDGEYTISSNMQQLGSFWDAPDHTGNPNGKMLIVNADFNAGIFYQTPISGLCENTPYEFSSWVINVLSSNNPCGANEIPIQVRFEIWDSTDTTLLADGVMNPRGSDPAPSWVRYGLTFTTATGQNGCILKLINEGIGGCGNDLAIDDIEFRPCGDQTSIINATGSNSTTICENDPGTSVILTATASTSIFSTPAYQWQVNTGGNFTDIAGATNSTYTTPVLNTNTAYRVKVAEDAVNLNNSQCINFSEIFEFERIIVDLAVSLSDPFISCNGELEDLIVSISPGLEANWYDSPTGGTLVNEDSIDYSTTVPGTYYVETRDIASGCISSSRVPVNYIFEDSPVVNSEDFLICPGDTAFLDTQSPGNSYEWSTGETTSIIQVNAAGNYICEVINAAGCSSTAIFNVEVVELPIIEELVVNDNQLTIVLENSGNFQFSINGRDWTTTNTFDITTFLQVVARVRDDQGCDVVTQEFLRIDIPKYFTPNNDGFNDTFEIRGIDRFPQARLEIFDRYGKLLNQINNLEVGWDGLYRNQPLPSDDYWFKLYYNDQIISGHFALKR